jgi:hypothetical protein
VSREPVDMQQFLLDAIDRQGIYRIGHGSLSPAEYSSVMRAAHRLEDLGLLYLVRVRLPDAAGRQFR